MKVRGKFNQDGKTGVAASIELEITSKDQLTILAALQILLLYLVRQ